jgi:hypothetical protein
LTDVNDVGTRIFLSGHKICNLIWIEVTAFRRLVSTYRQFVVDNENVDNHCWTIVRTYSGALTGIHVFLILDFQDQ